MTRVLDLLVRQKLNGSSDEVIIAVSKIIFASHVAGNGQPKPVPGKVAAFDYCEKGMVARNRVFQVRSIQKWPLFAQIWSKNATFGRKTVSFGLCSQFKPCPPYPAAADLKQISAAGFGPRKRVFQRPSQRKAHFLLKRSLKMPIWGYKNCSLG